MSEIPKPALSYLKGLAETRARLAGDIERYRMVIEDVGRQLLKAETELEACDLLIRKFDSRLRPERIPPIRAPRLPGKRGAIRATLIAILSERTPACLTTRERIRTTPTAPWCLGP